MDDPTAHVICDYCVYVNPTILFGGGDGENIEKVVIFRQEVRLIRQIYQGNDSEELAVMNDIKYPSKI